jgi:hypothetical protein
MELFMDRSKIVQSLGLIDSGTFFVTDLEIKQWGRKIIFKCDYQTIQPDGTPDNPVLFDMIFRDCREIKWKTYAHIALAEVGHVPQRTELAEMSLGHGNHRRDANLLFAHFGVTLSYGELIIQYGDNSYTIQP